MRVRRGLRIAIDHEANRVPWEPMPLGQVILVEAKSFDEAWKRHDWPHIGPGGAGQNDGRYDRFETFFFTKILSGTALKCAFCDLRALEPLPQIAFFNGRHRTAWLRDHGLNPLPISVHPDEVKVWKRVMGAKVLPWGNDLWWTIKVE